MTRKKTGNPVGKPPKWHFDIQLIARLRNEGMSWVEIANNSYENCPSSSLKHWVNRKYRENTELSYSCLKTGKLVKY